MRSSVRAAALTVSLLILFATGTAAGTTSYTSKVTLSDGAPYWHGAVMSKRFGGVAGCERDRRVKVFRRQDGKDLKIGTDKSNGSGRWAIPDKPSQGTYYARVTERPAERGRPGCDADDSGIVVVD